MDAAEVEIQHEVEPARLQELMELYRAEWWTAERTAADVAAMLEGSDLVFALVHRPTDGLVGFARVLTDDTYLAVALDVIVTREWRSLGVGATLMEAVVGHPRLAAVRTIELVCQPELIPFYRRFGFTERVGRSLLMRRTSDPLLVSG